MIKIELEDFLGFTFLSALQVSPTGKYVAFIRSQCAVEQNNYLSELWLYDVEGARPQRLCTMPSGLGFTWLDAETLLFPRSSNGRYLEPQTEYAAISVAGDEAYTVFTMPLLAKQIKRIDDDLFVVLATTNLNDPADLPENGADWVILNELPFAENGAGYVSGKRSSLFLFDARIGETTPITTPYFNTKSVEIDAQSGRVVYIGQENTCAETAKDGLYCYDVADKTSRCLVSTDRYRIFRAGFFQDQVWFTGSDGSRYPWSQNAWFYTVDEKDEEVVLYESKEAPCNNTINSDCRYGAGLPYAVSADAIYHVQTSREHAQILRIGDGAETQITTLPGAVDCLAIVGEMIYFIGLRGQRLQELYQIAKDGGTEVRLTSFNEAFFQQKSICEPLACHFTASSGDEIEGWVMPPRGYNPHHTKKYPAILNIHGGPKTAYGTVYVHEMQLWANCGYFVMYCNPRGSDGRGDAFAYLMNRYATVDYDDLMEFVDTVLTRWPLIDATRLGVTGGSYGGYMTNWIVGKTNRFAAAVAQRSISNWLTDEGASDFAFLFNRYRFAGQLARQVPEHAWQSSPLRLAGNVRTPLLFIHAEEDFRCPPGEAMQLYTALINRGVETKICMFKGENHELSRSGTPKNRVKRLAEITAWMDDHLLQEEEHHA